jgi:hypothetical protein
LCFAVALLAPACGGKADPARSVDELHGVVDSTPQDADPRLAVHIRFAIEVDGSVGAPVYVLLNGEDDQVGWVTAFGGGERVYFSERCDVEDCGAQAAVCGAAIPMVSQIASDVDRRTIEFVWDGMTSELDSRSGCETRQPAVPGDYVARFCFSREAELDGDLEQTQAAPGRLIRPTCTERPFNLRDREVVLKL